MSSQQRTSRNREAIARNVELRSRLLSLPADKFSRVLEFAPFNPRNRLVTFAHRYRMLRIRHWSKGTLCMCGSSSSARASNTAVKTEMRLSPWVNERLPPLQDLLCSHDVERLTRRPRWILEGLGLIGRFPRRKTFRGRKLGWCRAEVFDWMSTRGVGNTGTAEVSVRSAEPAQPHQLRLPLRCGARPAILASVQRARCAKVSSRIPGCPK